ncbi:MAG TPA: IS1634 family transposase [Candidatus Angelobacter sp.]
MFLKAHERCKDGKRHVYYSLTESLRVSRKRVVQRTVLHLGELNTTQVERWQRTIEAIHEDGQRRQLRLFTDREGQVPVAADDVAEVILSSLVVRRPRRFGDCWIGCKLWEDLGLRAFWQDALGEQRGEVPWAKVVELLVVNRLCDPRSELFIHEKWFPQTAMDLLLDSTAAVAEKDRLYRALDRMVAHKDALERHLADKWRDLFGASFDVLLYDLTSTYFEGEAEGVEKAARGYSRDHRPDCAQLVIAIVVTPEGFPLSYEVFDGNRADVTTLEAMLDQVEAKHGRARRIWVFDRGIVSEANLQRLRERGGQYVVGTPRHRLGDYEKELLEGSWQQINESVQVQLIAQDQETYVLARSVERAKKEEAMRWRQIRGLMRDLVRLRRSIRKGTLADSDKVLMRLGRLSERWPRAWHDVSTDWKEGKLSWHWDRQALRLAQHRDGAYLLRTNLSDHRPEALWRMYVQLTEVEAVFRALKSELAIRPIWHWVGPRVEAHVLVAFLGYCLWVCLKQKLKASAPGLSPWQLLDQFQRIVQVEVWFKLKAGGAICLPRITQPEPAQAMIMHQLNWSLPEQPPPRIYQDQVADVWPT